MRYTILLSALGAALLLASPPAAATNVAERYVAPSGDFSIAMQTVMDREFHVGRENANADILLVDFQYSMAEVHRGFAQRTVEWLRLSRPVDPAQYDAMAQETVSGYLEGRFAGNTFNITGRQKARNAAGQLVYVFTATGTFNGKPSAWQGVVLYFDSGVALVSQLQTTDTTAMLEADGLTGAELTAWAATIRPRK